MGKEDELVPLLKTPLPQDKPFYKAMILCSMTMVLFMSGVIAFPPLQSQLIRQRVAESYFNSSNATADEGDFCKRNKSDENVQIGTEIQKKSAELLLYFGIPGGIISIFVNLVLGSYSDFLGRKILFAIPTLGAVMKGVVLSVIVGLHLPLNWFYLAMVIEGLTGGFSAFLLAVFSYTADVTEPGRTRTLMIAFMEGVLALAGSLGQLGLGYVIQDLSFLYAGIGVSSVFALALVVICFLPETMTTKAEKQWSPIPHAKKVFGFFFLRGTCRQRALYIVSIFIFYFGIIVSLGRTSVETLYQLDEPFCWSSLKIGYYGAIRLSVSVIFSLVVLKLLQPCFRDMTIALAGIVFGVASFTLEGLAVNDWMLYIVPVIGCIAFNAVPVTRATMSKMTSPFEQGALFSSIATMETICNMMSNALYNAVYEGTVGVFRGAVFLLMAGFSVLTAGFIMVFLYMTKGRDPVYEVIVSPPEDDASSTIPDSNSVQRHQSYEDTE